MTPPPEERHLLDLSCRQLYHIMCIMVVFRTMFESERLTAAYLALEETEPNHHHIITTALEGLADVDTPLMAWLTSADTKAQVGTQNLLLIQEMLKAQSQQCQLYHKSGGAT